MRNTDIKLPKLSMPKGGGSFSENSSYVVNPQGEGSFSIPINLPSARGNTPALNLSYAVGGGIGLFGLGFGVTLPVVTRDLALGVPKYNQNDIFLISGFGELTVINQQLINQQTIINYRPRIEGSFAHIQQTIAIDGTSFWQVTAANGHTDLYGVDENSRIFDPMDKSRILEWKLVSSKDAKGNIIEYSYKREDKTNIPNTPSENNRLVIANLYPSHIKYGNWEAQKGSVDFTYHLMFDYGEYDMNNPEAPLKDWSTRPDPFSRYQAGFEQRCYRLCRRVLFFHSFPQENSGKPYLNRSWELNYQQESISQFSQLISVREIGYRKLLTKYQQKKMPQYQFQYLCFNPKNIQSKSILINNKSTLTDDKEIVFIDLNGEGLPGILYQDQESFLYAEPLGSGCYEAFSPASKPSFEIGNLTGSFQDLNGNSKLDWVFGDIAFGGYFARDNKQFLPYQEFKSYTSAFTDPTVEHIDLSGNGFADMVKIDKTQILVYPSIGADGFGKPYTVAHNGDIPTLHTPNQWVGFSDMVGDGRMHRVRICNGSVEYWPSLGFGHFGQKIMMNNAPKIDSFDAKHIYLIDTDGSGTSDIVVMKNDKFIVYPNNIGNGFGQYYTVSLPIPYVSNTRIFSADISGNGTASLILSTPGHHTIWFDFAAKGKPHTLNKIFNGIGGQSEVTYCSSTDFYLADKAKGKPWKTCMKFPIQLVNSVSHYDLITHSKYTSRYAYHEGNYDSLERKFRGFGMMEFWDSETTPLNDKTLNQPPIYHKSWYFNGVIDNNEKYYQQLLSNAYKEDTKAYILDNTIFNKDVLTANVKTIEEAWKSLQGHIIREEIYANDDSLVADVPYEVNTHNYQVDLIQQADPSSDARHGFSSLLVIPRESLTYHYERNVDDPRVTHNINLKWDKYGHITDNVTVGYPRRPNSKTSITDKVYPQQQQLHLQLSKIDYFNQDSNDMLLLGIPITKYAFEICGLKPLKIQTTKDNCFKLKQLLSGIAQALKDTVPYGKNFTKSKVQARLFQLQRYYYWQKDKKSALPLGQATLPLLPHHSEIAAYTSYLIESVYADKVSASMLVKNGYNLEKDIWWAPGPTTYFDNKYSNIVRITDVLGKDNLVAYDAQGLFPITGSKLIINAFSAAKITHQVTAKIDYQALRIKAITNSNGNISEAIFDPLGEVIATTQYGTTNGEKEGNDPIDSYHMLTPANIEDITNKPEAYIQNTSSYFYYDMLAWEERKQPLAAVSITRDRFVHDLLPIKKTQYPVSIGYHDGLGRTLQTKVKIDKTGNNTYISSGQHIYNNKGKVVKVYLPYFSTHPNMDISLHNDSPPPSLFYYDPLGRLFKTQNPKDLLQKTNWTPWSQQHYDANDTIKDSLYYHNVMTKKIILSAAEKAALKKAIVFYDTPEISLFDSLGHNFANISILCDTLLPKHQYLTTHTTLDIRGLHLTQTDPRLGANTPPIANIVTVYDMRGKEMVWKNVDSGIRINVNNIRGSITNHWDARGVHIKRYYDNVGRPVRECIAQQDVKNTALDKCIHEWHYGDFIINPQINNFNNKLYKQYDSAGVVELTGYSIQGHSLGEKQTFLVDYKHEPDWNQKQTTSSDKSQQKLVEKIPKLEKIAYLTEQNYNALGNVIQLKTPDGSTQTYQYNLLNQLISLCAIHSNDKTVTQYLQSVSYDAQGKPISKQLGNGVLTTWVYELSTEHLLKTLSKTKQGVVCENLSYTWDPVGNLSQQVNGVINSLFKQSKEINPISDYSYDSIYRLKTASGYQNADIQKDTHWTGFKQSIFTSLKPEALIQSYGD